MESPSSRKQTKGTSFRSKGKPTSVAVGTSEGLILQSAPAPVITKTNAPTSAHSAEKKPTTHSRGPVTTTPLNQVRRIDAAYVDILPSVFQRVPILGRSPFHESIISRIVTPYNPDAFESFLNKHNLNDTYPFLTRNLRYGFPLGEFPDLTDHVIFPFHNSSRDYQVEIDAYLEEEVSAGRMSGPFSKDETTLILNGPFQCSPFVVEVQQDKLRICLHLSKGDKHHVSVNSFIDSGKFPTRFGSTAEMAEIISSHTLYAVPILPHELFLPYLFPWGILSLSRASSTAASYPSYP
ncbi:hypothetical protein APHAL10511_003924 [Amanita phalloides]|nr:hypothetical protein APHAL10511_003924 [Amanita phalloides]